MLFRRFLLASASVLTILAGCGIAAAQDGKFILGVTGGPVLGDNGAAEAFARSEAYDLNEFETPEFAGSYFALVVGKEIVPLWDVRLRYAYTHVDFAYGDFNYSEDKLGELGTGLDYQTLDVEAGYTPALSDDLELRFVTGVRALHVADRMSVRDKIGDEDEDLDEYNNKFFGVGPRVAVETAYRFDGGPLGVSASAGGAVTFGELNRSVDGDEEDTLDKTVVTLDAKVSLDYYLGDVAKVSLGYRGEVLSGIHEFDVNEEDVDGNQLTHGPVLEILASF